MVVLPNPPSLISLTSSSTVIPKLKKILKKIISDDYVEELLETNGRKVLNNEKIEFREMIPLKKNVFGQYK